MTIQEFFMWLAGGLGSSAVVSYIAERLSWFQALSMEAKKFWSTVGATFLALAAFAVYTYVPASFWAMIMPYWQIVLGVIAVNYGTQMFHRYDKNLNDKV